MSARIAEMTWRDVERARDAGAAILFPMGSTEEHGPHTPMGDYMAAEEIAVRAAEATGSLVVPALPYSFSEYFRDFPGTISVSWQTLSAVVEEVVCCYLDQGFAHIVLVNGHKGNEPVVLALARKLRRERGIMLPVVSPLGLALTPELTRELYDGKPIGHGGEPMGSLMWHFFPHLVQPEAAEDYGVGEYLGVKVQSLNGLSFQGSEVLLPLNMADIAPPSGSMADPKMASEERGERIASASVDKLIAFVRWWKTVDPSSPAAGVAAPRTS